MTETLSAAAARALTDEVKADTHALWLKLERLYEGNAHGALGHKSWHAYCAAEFSLSSTRAYELLDAGRVASILERSGIPESPVPQSEAVANELASLRREPEALQAAWSVAVEQHGPNPTAAQVRLVVRGPGDDIRFSRIENAADSLRTLPAWDKLAWPVEPGDIAAMDIALDWLCAEMPAARKAWRAHKMALRAQEKARKARGRHLRSAA